MSRARHSRFVEWDGRLVPASLFGATDDLTRKPDCGICCDRGVLQETIDEERYDVMVPCWHCRMYCKACGKHVKKSGHECKGVKDGTITPPVG